ncbi:MarR family winged helix-turn-helix transcriptional regulator [Oscillospiraceae bacterium LTW-04]|nr:MarR family transcriptional regulator [Oscillospiraceae bacterium MB24-C1]
MQEQRSYLYHIFFRICRHFMQVRRNNGLRPGEFSVLWTIEQAEGQALHPAEISKHMGITRPSLTPILRDLEARGLIQCRIDSQDGRRYLVEITDKCREFRIKQINRHKLLFDQLIGNLDQHELEDFLRILHKLEANLQNEGENNGDTFL